MSDKIRCPKGHFYNGKLFDSCPHCADGMAEGKTEHIWGAGAVTAAKEDKPTTSKQRTGLSIWKKKEKEVVEEVVVEKPQNDRTERVTFWGDEQPASQEEERKPKVADEMDTGYGYQKAPAQNDYGYAADNRNLMQQNYVQPQENRGSLQAGLAQAARPAENLDDGKTVGYFHTSGHEEPPVGYLICTAGDDYGKGFLLKSGNNNVGRSSAMDVIVMDPKVSREKQLSVIYEPHKREFFVKPGEGSSLSYYNDELLLGVQKLQSHDVLAIGDTKLMLIPVCSEKFSWDS